MRSIHLTCVQQHVTSSSWKASHSEPPAQGALYAAWFWQSFGLLQLERMARSDDSFHLLAVDMMLTACLSGTWRSYFDIRALPWNGEKAALRYWKEHFPYSWAPEGLELGAGPYPLSEPETRALIAFVSLHPNIGCAISYHTYSGAILRPFSDRPDEAMAIDDLWTYEEIDY